jgi:hypothetical protein
VKAASFRAISKRLLARALAVALGPYQVFEAP